MYGMKTKEDITLLINEAKKEVDRLEDNRHKELSDSINYIENELKIQQVKARIEAFEEVLGA
ncbi:MAG: hypothetical protein ACTJHC_08830 [Vagococcus sp.]